MSALCLEELRRDIACDSWRPYWKQPEPSKALATMLSLIAASEAEQRAAKTTEDERK